MASFLKEQSLISKHTIALRRFFLISKKSFDTTFCNSNKNKLHLFNLYFWHTSAQCTLVIKDQGWQKKTQILLGLKTIKTRRKTPNNGDFLEYIINRDIAFF